MPATKGKKAKAQDHEPAWLNEENDGEIKDEIAPLLGTGKIDLTDEPKEEEKQEETYGSTANDDEEAQKPKKTADAADAKEEDKKKEEKPDPKRYRPEMPHPSCLMAVFFFLEGCGIVSSLALLVTQIIPIAVAGAKEVGVVSLALKVYVSLFCVVFVMVESDAPIPFIKTSSLLQNYFSRGFLYSFLGLNAAEEAYSERVKDILSHSDEFHVSWTAMFISVSAWIMMALGVIYMLLGICCIKRVRDRQRQLYREQWNTYRERMKIYREYRE